MNAKLIAFATTAVAVIVGLYAYKQIEENQSKDEFRGGKRR